MRVQGTLGFSLLILLAGCAGAPPDTQSDPRPTVAAAEPVRVDPNTGGISGRVTDEELRPIARARVGLLEAPELVVDVDAAGAFTFSELAPGSYRLVAQALGYEDAARTLEVSAGNVAEVALVLVALPVREPRVVHMVERGVAACFVSYRTSTSSSAANIYCGHAHDTAGLNRHRIFWQTLKPTEGWSDSVFEMTWRSTQIGGHGMQGKLYIASSGISCGELVFVEGISPLKGAAVEGSIDAMKGNKASTCPAECNATECKLQSWVGGLPHVLGSSQPVDAGLLLDQTFEQHHSAFFHQMAPAAYSALPNT